MEQGLCQRFRGLRGAIAGPGWPAVARERVPGAADQSSMGRRLQSVVAPVRFGCSSMGNRLQSVVAPLR